MQMRVMHLIEPWTGVGPARGTDAAVLACRSLIAATPTDWHEPIAIGATSGRVRARHLGLDIEDGITPPGSAPRAWHQLRAVALARGCPDVVQTWSTATHELAIRAAVAPAVSRPWDIEAIPRIKLPQQESRDTIRLRWGLQGETPIIAAIADPPGSVDAVRFVLLLGLLEQIGVRVAGVIESAAGSLARACVFARQIGLTQPMVISDRPILGQTAGVDLAVWVPHARTEVDLWSATLLVRACHAAALPVVCPDAWRNALGDPDLARHLVCTSSDPSAMLRTLAPILESPGALEDLAQAVRSSRTDPHEDSGGSSGIHKHWARAARGLGVT